MARQIIAFSSAVKSFEFCRAEIWRGDNFDYALAPRLAGDNSSTGSADAEGVSDESKQPEQPLKGLKILVVDAEPDALELANFINPIYPCCRTSRPFHSGALLLPVQKIAVRKLLCNSKTI